MNDFPFFSPNRIRTFLEEQSANPKKSWGQNYLIDRNTIDSIFQDIGNHIPPRTDSVAEIGIGLGALTHRIMDLPFPKYFFEIDPVSCRLYREGIGKDSEATLFEGDCRDHLPQLKDLQPFLFGNLPYYITSDIITLCLEEIPRMTGFLFLVQKEFADRILNDISSLSVFIHFFGIPQKYKTIKKTCFYPAPKIDSTLLLFQSREESIFSSQKEIAILSGLLRSSFWGKRKKLATSLRDSPRELFNSNFFKTDEDIAKWKEKFQSVLEEYQFLDSRPEEISIENWLSVGKKIIFS
ncbi:MAG: 16S rRNA (adenine(1518)-N(6)/adenine(1519)-N(6))-dimethyltransferase [Leptospira sp.]|nr:16S rRNA (adenine(1518)-N(6)/adenine(1519)-N(6))-dimethyltransferase [Leptospira sp.]